MIDVVNKINDFILKNFLITKNYDSNMSYIDELRSFLKEIKYSLKIDDIIELLKNNSVFYNCIENIFEYNKEAIIGGNMDRTFKNATIKNCLYTFCMVNDIDIVDEPVTAVDNNSCDILNLYFRDVASFKLLSLEEEKELANKYLAGDKEAKDLFINSNLRLVINRAKRYYGRGLSFEDLIGYGNFGLLKAVDNFLPEKGRFSTYAIWWIDQYIRRSLSDYSRTIRLPVHLDDDIKKFNDAEETLTKELNRFPTDDEIIYRYTINKLIKKLGRKPTKDELDKEIESSKERYNYTRNANSRLVSLDLEIGEDGDVSVSDLIPDISVNVEEQVQRNGIRDYVRELLEYSKSNMKERELEVIKCRFYFYDNRKFSLEETGKRLNITRERVRQIESNAIRKLRNAENRLRARKKGGIDINNAINNKTMFTHSEEAFIQTLKTNLDTDSYERLLELIVIAKSYSNVNIRELSIALLDQGFINNHKYATNEISNILSIDYESVILLKHKALIQYKGIMNMLNERTKAYVKKLRP